MILNKINSKIFLVSALVVGFVTILLCYLTVGKFFDVISTFGVTKSTELIFNLGIILSGILLLLFWVSYLKNSKIISRPLKIIIFLISILLSFVGLFPTLPDATINGIHWFSALIFLYIYPIILIYILRELKLINQTIGVILFILNFIVMFTGFTIGSDSPLIVAQFMQIIEIVLLSLIILYKKKQTNINFVK